MSNNANKGENTRPRNEYVPVSLFAASTIQLLQSLTASTSICMSVMSEFSALSIRTMTCQDRKYVTTLAKTFFQSDPSPPRSMFISQINVHKKN